MTWLTDGLMQAILLMTAGVAERPEHVNARHAGHHDVEDDDRPAALLGGLEGLRAVGAGDDRVARRLELDRDEVADVAVVVDHQDARAHAAPARRVGAGGLLGRMRAPT